MRKRIGLVGALAGITAIALVQAPAGSATPKAEKSAYPAAANGRIVFASSRDLGIDASDVFVMGSDGSNPLNLTPGGEMDTAVDASFSPDGKKILFLRPEGGDFDVFSMNADGTNPAYSPDGKKIAFARDVDPGAGDNLDLFVANADGSGAVDVTPSSPTQDAAPDFSPDGQRIIYSTFDGGDPDYFAIGVDGSNPINLTAANPGADHDGVFTPDGKRIALAREMDPGPGVDYDIVLVNAADGSNPVDITPDPAVDDRSPAPSPDGQRIAFEQAGDVFIAAIDGSGATNLTGAADGRNPKWEYLYSCAGRPATMIGTDSRDVLKGTKRADVIVGNGGDDKLVGRGGKDRICGGAGKDKLKGGAGNDRLLGQAGKDKLTGGKGKDIVKGGKGKDVEKQ
jgi:Tol biopolymer transport system component